VLSYINNVASVTPSLPRSLSHWLTHAGRKERAWRQQQQAAAASLPTITFKVTSLNTPAFHWRYGRYSGYFTLLHVYILFPL